MCVKNNDDFCQVKFIKLKKYTVSLTPCEYSRTKNGKLLRHQTPNKLLDRVIQARRRPYSQKSDQRDQSEQLWMMKGTEKYRWSIPKSTQLYTHYFAIYIYQEHLWNIARAGQYPQQCQNQCSLMSNRRHNLQ